MRADDVRELYTGRTDTLVRMLKGSTKEGEVCLRPLVYSVSFRDDVDTPL